ncbi:DUF460 domain-containing protein [Candidatus Woesearchaeota archaeon]|nr:DUF460 domain-containing protein [Candidatus Woesearchaeota archaeon]
MGVIKIDRPYSFIGLDPGTTKSYAIIDINGNLLSLKSSKKLDLNKSIQEISNISKVIAVGTDINPAPKFVEKFASSLSAKIIRPEKTLQQKDKWRIAKEYLKDKKYTEKIKIENKHQRDALTGAVLAYKNYKTLFNKVDNKLIKNNKSHLNEEIKNLIITKNFTIKKAISVIGTNNTQD